MKEIKAVIHPTKLSPVMEALHRIPNMPGLTVSTVQGYGKSPEIQGEDGENHSEYTPVEMSKIEIVIPDVLVQPALDTILEKAQTGHVGDGKIFVYEVSNVIKIRTGDKGEKAI